MVDYQLRAYANNQGTKPRENRVFKCVLTQSAYQPAELLII